MSGYPNRCQHLKLNGTQCGSPALRRNRFCFFHKRFRDEQIALAVDRKRRAPARFFLPVLDDANSIQIALMQIMRLILSHQIEHKSASLLLYALQTASTNLRQTDFKPHRHEVILDPRDAADSSFGFELWSDEDFEDDEEDEDDEVETETDRAIAALEQVKKDRKDDAKWMAWAERQYPRQKPSDFAQTAAPAPQPAAPAAKPKPLPDLKKPPTEATPAEVRAQISAMVRESLPKFVKVLEDAKQKEEQKKKDNQTQAT